MISEIRRLMEKEDGSNFPIVVDLGCGQLRNVDTLLGCSNKLYIVDTEYQLSRPHNFNSESLTVYDFVKTHYSGGDVTPMNTLEFGQSELAANLIFIVNVLDVTPPETRNEILRAARQNLAKGGLIITIAPRNDSHTLKLCTEERRYRDGFVFPNHGAYTYYKNWSSDDLKRLFKRHGLKSVSDTSNYRHACNILSQ